MDRLGLDWATLRATNPRLVVGSITGYGASGPMADAPAIDGVVQAFSGSFGLPQVYGLPAGPVPMTIADLATCALKNPDDPITFTLAPYDLDWL